MTNESPFRKNRAFYIGVMLTVCHSFLYGQKARSDLHKRATLCCGVERDLSLWFQCCRKHHLPAAEKTGTRSEESSLY